MASDEETRRRILLESKHLPRGIPVEKLKRMIGRSSSSKKTIRCKINRPKQKLISAYGTGYENVKSDEFIFFTGGIGDIFALESFFPDVLRANLSCICYATNKSAAIQELFFALPNYKNLKQHIVIWDDFKDFWCFFTKEECRLKLNQNKIEILNEFAKCEDYGIYRKFNQIAKEKIPYNKSSFIVYKLADIAHFNLPEKFVCICPFSSDKRMANRDFSENDWQATILNLNKRGIKGVVLNSGNDIIPSDPSLINLTDQTTILEAIEILKASAAYIGIDSCMSILAAKLFVKSNLIVKTCNAHLVNWKHVYYAPQVNFDFIVKDIPFF